MLGLAGKAWEFNRTGPTDTRPRVIWLVGRDQAYYQSSYAKQDFVIAHEVGHALGNITHTIEKYGQVPGNNTPVGPVPYSGYSGYSDNNKRLMTGMAGPKRLAGPKLLNKLERDKIVNSKNMQTNTNSHVRALLVLIQTITLLTHAQTSPSPVRDDEWRRQELRRAKPLINQHDFSPIDEAFVAKDLLLLWCYYLGDYELKFQLYDRATPERLRMASPEKVERMKLVLARYERAGSYLKQIPGHPRLVGDKIEESLYGRAGGMDKRSAYMECLCRLGQDGSDECIEQLGRYLFDTRDPGFRPYDPAQPRLSEYDMRGVHNWVQSDAVSGLLGILKDRFEFAKVLVDENSVPFKGMPIKGYEDKLREWLLTSPEAAPYRRSLASTGVVLPPGYPPMKELEGTKTTIAPPLKNPPYPDGVTPFSSTPVDPNVKP